MPVTPFQQTVYDAISLIPKGNVTTYAEVSRYLKCNSAQAIGQALKRNPYAPEVPCHRVVSSQMTIGGFKGKRSGQEIIEKIDLLKSEGVIVDAEGSIPQNTLFKY